MTVYEGNVEKYDLIVRTPTHKSLIILSGDFGLAFLVFLPQGATLSPNQKRAGQKIFDIYYWTSYWPYCTDLLRNEKPVWFIFDDTTKRAEIRTYAGVVGEAEPPVVIP